ncbi:TPA: tail fiber assembly protein [Salmonella enterica subsp. enterica serovar Ball]|uniref:Tail assembly chaperone gp38 n=1 Tax=Salmonella enterica subsp. salamae TaxID=59202 RepID=A0A6D2GEB7_SALER|nr:tail fiber assembly protein [Salmonella enterica]EAW1762543.1 tail fiber assembly protein [Salmonella enterica subsp. enterica]EBW4676872.1 tail fiber assembly protein [Salmonella enterica subsp. salamae serovar Sofia]EDW0469381.1 tail fiber assembly protein [Salmonella enterica subsp. enterica serovar Victoria]EKR2077440.1 tail fiber assembly protein [Salmonella enterica subsp. salamae serovar 9,46:l,w:e,n,x]HCA3408376.1 tail fiber assembly protein [Salmonella enterica subsp. salamae serov
MKLKSVKRYYPDDMPFGENIQYFIDENGVDFYSAIEHFNLKYKLCIHPETKVIHSVSEDISKLYPAGFDIVETDNVPYDDIISGKYQFVDNRIIMRTYNEIEITQITNIEKSERLKLANKNIMPLQDAVDLGIATTEEMQKLDAWKKYRVEINRTNTSNSLNISWPLPPNV